MTLIRTNMEYENRKGKTINVIGRDPEIAGFSHPFYDSIGRRYLANGICSTENDEDELVIQKNFTFKTRDKHFKIYSDNERLIEKVKNLIVCERFKQNFKIKIPMEYFCFFGIREMFVYNEYEHHTVNIKLIEGHRGN